MNFTVRDIMRHLNVGAEQRENTVDLLIAGSPEQQVKGVVTAFMPTHHVIEETIRLGANLIISHESPFYSHHGHTDWLASDPVYQHKRRLIEDAGIAIFRCHDSIHQSSPDGITEGLVHALGWLPHVEKRMKEAHVLSFPEEWTLRDMASHIRNATGIEYLRAVGDPGMVCRRAAILVGFRGNGNLTIPLMQQERLDLIIAGEGFEWETPEYVRDAVGQGLQKALIMMGHAESEIPGMRMLADRLKVAFKELNVQFVPNEPVYRVF